MIGHAAVAESEPFPVRIRPYSPIRTPVGLARLSLSVFGAVGVVAATLAGATIWLLLTDPVTVADAIQTGEVSPVVKALAGALYDAMRGILKYL
jgi:hypothetical protein